MEYKVISSRYWVSPFRHFKHRLNENTKCIQNRNPQRGEMLIRREKRDPMKMTGEEEVSSMHFDSSFRPELRTSKGGGKRSGGLHVCSCTEVGWCSAQVDEQDVNKVKKESPAVCRLRLKSGFGRVNASDPFYRSFRTKNLHEQRS